MPGAILDGTTMSSMCLGGWQYMEKGSAERTALHDNWEGKTWRTCVVKSPSVAHDGKEQEKFYYEQVQLAVQGED